jgi:type IV pilus secretin PilQ/predicted competence protein
MRFARRASSFGLLFLLAAGVPAGAQTAPAVKLSEVTVATQPDTVTVFVKTSGAAKYQAELIDTPARLVVDFEDTTYGWRKTPLTVSAGPLKQIRGSQYRKGVARVVVELTRPVGYAIREDDDGLTIVIPTNAPPFASTASVPAPKVATNTPVPATASTAMPDTAATPQASAVPQATPAPPATAAPQTAPAPMVTARPVPSVRIAQAPVTPAPPAAPAPAVTASQVPETQRLISLDFKDADVVNLLRILAAESSKNIVIGDDVKGKMSITLRNVPWQLALETIMEARGLVKTERDNVIRIVSQEQLAKERDAATRLEDAKRKASSETRLKEAETALKEQEAIDKRRAAELAQEDLIRRGPLTEETIRLSYGDPDDIAKTLQGILGIPAEGIQAQTPLTSIPAVPGQGPIPAPPFSQLFGPGQPLPPAVALPPSDVLAKGITIRAHRPTNSLFIRHYQADLARIKKLIEEKLDIPLPQVKIEARMEILARDDLFAFGIQFGGGGVATTNQATVVGRGFTSNQAAGVGIAPVGLGTGLQNSNLTLSNALPVSATTGLPVGGNVVNLPIGSLLAGAAGAGTGGLAFGIIGSRLNLNLALEALKSEGKTRTLARPEVVTVENNKAAISLGEEIPYATISSAGTQIQFKEALLKLEVTPTVVREIDHNRIKMKVLVENNSRGTTTIDLGSAGAPPVIVRRKAETEVLIREGERLVIGGVTNNEATEQTRKVPLFGDVPLLGWLFKQTGEQNRATELVVFITPTIIRRDTASASVPGTTIAPR